MKTIQEILFMILIFVFSCDNQSISPDISKGLVNIPDENFLNALIEESKKGNKFSDSELDLLKQNYEQDDNNYIKFKTRTILQEYN